MQTIVGLVASGVGIAILPESTRRVHCEGVSYRMLDAGSRLALATLEGKESLLVENFVRTLREISRGRGVRLLAQCSWRVSPPGESEK